MKTVSTHSGRARRFFAALVVVFSLAVGAVSASAYTTAQFLNVHAQITNDIAAVAAIENPTRSERALLRALQKASNTLNRVSYADGKMLRSLNTILGKVPSYVPTLTDIRSNLLVTFNAEYAFVGDLIDELPESAQAKVVSTQYKKFASTATKVNAAAKLSSFSALYDSAKTRLDRIFLAANEALIIPFPSDLSQNSVFARINGVSFRVSAGTSTENEFFAVATATNINLFISAEAISGGGARGIVLALPNVQFGAFRYSIPDEASFTNRTGIYPPESPSNVGATNGSVFINTTPTEVYGSFSCSGPGFNITDGRFRVTVSSQP